jgi:hypothetical protein
MPEDNWISTKGMETEKFVFIYVPAGVPWSLEGVIHPQNITIGKSGFPEFPEEAASRLLNDLKTQATRMSSSSAQSGQEIVNTLVAAHEPKTVTFYEFELTAIP